MSEKLEHALNNLAQSVENFEKRFSIAQQISSANAPQKTYDQNDLFGLSEKNSQQAARVLDRAINNMEKLAKGGM